MSESTEEAVASWWQWFTTIQPLIHSLDSTDHPLWDEVVERLKTIHDSLWFEISNENDHGTREFVFTAEGDIDAFPFADHLISTAPTLAGWKFASLKPAMGFEFQTYYEGIDFDPREMWFLPLENDSAPDSLGIQVGVKGYDSKHEREMQNAVMVILDTAIGERSTALDIDHIGVGMLPNDPDGEGYIHLPELPDYIAFWKRHHPNRSA